jgi:hypothetical protein
MKYEKTLFLLILIFSLNTGCDVYDEGFDISSATDECEASGGNCEEPTGANLLALSISNSNPATLKLATPCSGPGATCLFDIAGLCNEADYAQNIIEYRVYDHTNNNVPIVNLKKAYDICKRGKFKLQVSVSLGCVRTAKRLEIEIVGKDLQGTEFRNPLAARRDVDLLFIEDPSATGAEACNVL